MRSPALTPPGGRPVFGTAAATSQSDGLGAESAAPRAQDCVSFGGALSPPRGRKPRSGVEPPTQELHDGFLPCMYPDAMSAAIRGPGAPEAVGGQPLLHGALLELLEGQGLCHSAHPYHVLDLLWIVVLASATKRESQATVS